MSPGANMAAEGGDSSQQDDNGWDNAREGGGTKVGGRDAQPQSYPKPSHHSASCLPGMPATPPPPNRGVTLGDFFKLFADLLPHEVSLCINLLGALRSSDRIADAQVEIETRNVYNILSAFVESHRPHTDPKVLSALNDFVVSLSRYGEPTATSTDNRSERPLLDSFEAANAKATATSDLVPVGVEHASDTSSDFMEKEATEGYMSHNVRVFRSTPWLPPKSDGGLRKRLFTVLEDSNSSLIGKFCSTVLMLTIVVSTISFVMESMPEYKARPNECAARRAANEPISVEVCEPEPHIFFWYSEAVCIAIFSVDYLARILTVHAVPKNGNWLRCTLAYALEPLNVIDLIAVIPFYVGEVIGSGLGIMRMLRLARILRLFKTAKHHHGIMIFKDVLVMSGQPLLILVFFNVIITILFGSLIFFAEGQRYSVDEKFLENHPQGVFVRLNKALDDDEVSPFRSIPYALWWVLVTMTTVGYGDYAPTTRIGKAIGVCCFYVGIIFLALPISVLGSNFKIVYHRRMNTSKVAQISRRRPAKFKNGDGSAFIPWGGGVRRTIFLLLEDPANSKMSKFWSVFIIIVILVSTISFILESMPDFNFTPDECVLGAVTVANCKPRPQWYFKVLETICITIFSVDYFCRLLTVHTAVPEEAGIVQELKTEYMPLRVTVLYFCQWLNIIDFLAIVPFYVEQAGGGGGSAGVVRILRLVRIFRVLKTPKMRACAEMFMAVVADALPALLILFFMTSLMCVLFASLIVFAEGSWYSVDHFTDRYPEGVYVRPTKTGYGVEPSPFSSILYAAWWFFTTATTVGYGDDFPTTTSGRIVGVATFYTGIVLLALPITIVGGAFDKFYPEWVKEFGSSSQQIDEEETGHQMSKVELIENQFSVPLAREVRGYSDRKFASEEGGGPEPSSAWG